jgi:hypothetical protein
MLVQARGAEDLDLRSWIEGLAFVQGGRLVPARASYRFRSTDLRDVGLLVRFRPGNPAMDLRAEWTGIAYSIPYDASPVVIGLKPLPAGVHQARIYAFGKLVGVLPYEVE